MQIDFIWTEYQLHTICWNLKVTNTTAHLHTVHRTPSCYDVKPQISLDQMSGQRIHQTSMQVTIGSGADTKTRLSDSNLGHWWSEAAPYLCKQSVVDKAIEQWRPRRRACIHAKGQHFEQLLNWTLHFLSNIKIPHFLFNDNCSLHLGI